MRHHPKLYLDDYALERMSEDPYYYQLWVEAMIEKDGNYFGEVSWPEPRGRTPVEFSEEEVEQIFGDSIDFTPLDVYSEELELPYWKVTSDRITKLLEDSR